MDILFRKPKEEKLFNDFDTLKRELGKQAATKMTLRLGLLRAATRLEDLRHAPGHLHELRSDRQGQLALDITGNLRLVFEPANEPLPRKPDGGLDWHQITAVRIIEVVDYHG